jgi:hypothetical protein
MIVTGPDWESTRRLREALKDVPPMDKVIHYGAGGKNAVEQLTAFRAAGLLTPEWTTDLTQAQEWVRGGAAVWGRKLHHREGKDIVDAGYEPATQGEPRTEMRLKWITTRKGARVQRMRPVQVEGGQPESWNHAWLGRDFWVKVVPGVKEEWRIHVVNGLSVGRAEKHYVEGTATRQTEMAIRNRSTGWRMRHDVDPLPEVRAAGKAAVVAVGYELGAADLLLLEDGRVVVLEVNSAPSLRDEYTLQAYVKGLSRGQ